MVWWLVKAAVTHEEKEIWLFRKAEMRTKTIPGSPEVCWPRLCASYGWAGLAVGRVSQAELLKWQQTHFRLGPLRPQGPPRHCRHCRLLRGKTGYFHAHCLFFHQIFSWFTSIHIWRISIRLVIYGCGGVWRWFIPNQQVYGCLEN